MFKVNRLYFLLILVLVGGFVYWLYFLLQIRFSMGDAYPPYSSFRSDPMGTKALWVSLDELEGIEAVRHLGRSRKLEHANSTIFYFGVSPWLYDNVQKSYWEEILPLAQNGNHLVLGFGPANSLVSAGEEILERVSKEDEEPRDPLAFKMRTFESSPDANKRFMPAKAPEIREAARRIESPLPEVLPWRGNSYFLDLAPGWEVIYTVEDKPVVISKQSDGVSAILTTDSYFFSNLALWEARQPELLTWFMGGKSRIVFEETHLGLNASTNLMGLIRQFGLHGFLIGLILLGLLFIWQQAGSLLPPIEAEKRGTAQGKHAASGLMNLLGRGIPEKNLLDTCFQEWRKNLKAHQPMLRSREPEVEAFLRSQATEKPSELLVTHYNEIQRIVTRRRPFK